MKNDTVVRFFGHSVYVYNAAPNSLYSCLRFKCIKMSKYARCVFWGNLHKIVIFNAFTIHYVLHLKICVSYNLTVRLRRQK